MGPVKVELSQYFEILHFICNYMPQAVKRCKRTVFYRPTKTLNV